MKKEKIAERKKMILAMEFIARHMNDDTEFDRWLMCGVPDGDIERGSFDLDEIYSEDYMLTDEGLKDIMSCFLRCMHYSYVDNGGLYCDGVVCETKSK